MEHNDNNSDSEVATEQVLSNTQDQLAEEARLRLSLFSERIARMDAQLALVRGEMNAFGMHLREVYKIGPADSVNPDTGVITRTAGVA